MCIISWNCQGIHNPLTVQRLKELTHKHKPSILFLSETIASSAYMIQLASNLHFPHCFSLPPVGHRGGLSLFWTNQVNIQIVFANQSIIHSIVSSAIVSPWFLSTIYGPPHPAAREDNGNHYLQF